MRKEPIAFQLCRKLESNTLVQVIRDESGVVIDIDGNYDDQSFQNENT